MKNSLSYEYALHSLIAMALLPEHMNITIKQLSFMLGVTNTYLAKIFTQLGKAGLISTSLGSKGGISLAIPAEDITFYDVYSAINGKGHMFQCANIRGLSRGLEVLPGMCEVHSTIWEAEKQMFDRLKMTTIKDMATIAMKNNKLEDENTRYALVKQLITAYEDSLNN
ncbi:Rrf2 family transcriptional regulator [Bacillus salitolerans]|uniref:Rrf2 family transcriptional regulator n=1 Tax=Bacillus salitolerans TaxID=1437434 RepID=A0ABW4LTN0_9BACI